MDHACCYGLWTESERVREFENEHESALATEERGTERAGESERGMRKRENKSGRDTPQRQISASPQATPGCSVQC